jgi:flagellar hook-associated protein 2
MRRELSNHMDLGVSGLASGFDWKSFIDQMIDVQRAPEKRLLIEQNDISQQNNALSSIKTQFGVLSTRVDALKNLSLFNARSTSVSDDTVATATSSGSSPLGTFTLTVSQLATAAKQRGAANIGSPLSATSDVSTLVLGNAGFATDVRAGIFTINNKQITIATTDTLQAVFDKISAATGGTVTGSYDATNDKIVLTSASEIVLGTATDTSNFLSVAKLANNGAGDVESGVALGGIKRGKVLAEANFATAITDGGTGAGEFKINGVSINFSQTADSVQNVIDRINNSGAGVNASYDTVNDRFVLTSKSTGDMGVALEDVTGNFLAATGLSAGTLERGKDLLYSIDDGGELSSKSNTITEDSSGLAGLSINVFDEGTTQVTVASDSVTIKKAITDFIDEYNNLQKLIDKNVASTTDAKGKVTAGLLAQDNNASEIASSLRSMVVQHITTALGVDSLDDLGIKSNGDDDTLELDDESKLDTALADNLTGVTNLFTDATNGLAVKLADYIEKTTGDDGTLIAHQKTLTDQMTDIDDQVAQMERVLQDQKDSMTAKFIAMEQAQAQINQQLQYLQKNLGSSTTTK